MLTYSKFWLLAICLLSGCYSPPAKLTFPSVPDYFLVVEEARNQQRPILILFDWHGSSVDALEILAQPEVSKIISENYVFARVFTDNRDTWKDEKLRIDRNGYQITTIGGFYQDLQYRFFKDSFQPMYALLSPDGKPLIFKNHPLFEGYLSAGDAEKVQHFTQFLQNGLSAAASAK